MLLLFESVTWQQTGLAGSVQSALPAQVAATAIPPEVSWQADAVATQEKVGAPPPPPGPAPAG